jgi:hypothetical protein
MAKVYKVERRTTNGYWYEVMLSPFLRVRDAGQYIDSYGQYYPEEERVYRVLDQHVEGNVYSRIKRDADRVLNTLPKAPRR